MRSLIWKEFRENAKWTVVPGLLILGTMGLFGAFPLMEKGLLFFVVLIAAGFGAVLGFLQVFSESSGDKRSLLLHRPISRSHIFLGKALTGVGLYLVALGVPFACAVTLAATPGHVPEPFSWPMTLPWLADLLTGLVFYFGGMLTAQREARWYGSRCLGLAAGLACAYLVWQAPEFWHALVAIATLGGATAVAAWGSFLSGGAYAPQPRLAKVALGVTFLAGLSALSFTAKTFVGAWQGNSEPSYILDRADRVLVVHNRNGRMQSVTDLEGHTPTELQGKWLDAHTLKEIQAPWRGAGNMTGPVARSYRNARRFLIEFANDSKPGGELWWYVPAKGRLFGYDMDSKQFVGSFGPDGFCPPSEQPRERFQGKLLAQSVFFSAWALDYLTFADRVYDVDFRKRAVRTLFVPPAGETVMWAGLMENDRPELKRAAVVTDKWAHVLHLDKGAAPAFSAPRVLDGDQYELSLVQRLEDGQRYRLHYDPVWYLDVATLETLPICLVDYDAAGRELQRHTLPPRLDITGRFQPALPVAEVSYRQALFGVVTPPLEAAVLAGMKQHLFADFRASQGTEMWVLLQFLTLTTSYFMPGSAGNTRLDASLVSVYMGLMLLTAAVCGLACFLLARRYAFAPVRRLGWSLCGLLLGPAGLLLMLSLQEWPARIACPSCRQPRLVDRDRCEHCAAPHATPPPDGTEIFEQPSPAPHPVLAAH